MTATVAQARAAMQSFFHATWADKIPVAWDNTDDMTPSPDEPWVRVSVLHDGDPGSGQQTIGTNNLFRRTGNLVVNVFVPKGSGTEEMDGYVQDILNIFDEKTTAGPESVRFTAGRARENGVDGVWFMSTVVFDFGYDELK